MNRTLKRSVTVEIRGVEVEVPYTCYLSYDRAFGAAADGRLGRRGIELYTLDDVELDDTTGWDHEDILIAHAAAQADAEAATPAHLWDQSWMPKDDRGNEP